MKTVYDQDGNILFQTHEQSYPQFPEFEDKIRKLKMMNELLTDENERLQVEIAQLKRPLVGYTGRLTYE